MSRASKSEIVSLVVKCGGCEKNVEPESFDFEAEGDGTSCPGCDGSGGQYTCLCGGENFTKSLSFQCPLPECNFYGTIYVD